MNLLLGLNPANIATTQIFLGVTGHSILQKPDNLYSFLRGYDLDDLDSPSNDLYDIHHALQVLKTGAEKTTLPMTRGLRTSMTLLFEDYYAGYGFDDRSKKGRIGQNRNIAFGRLMAIATELLAYRDQNKLEVYAEAVKVGMAAHQVSGEIFAELAGKAEKPKAAVAERKEPSQFGWAMKHIGRSLFIGAAAATGILFLGYNRDNIHWAMMNPPEQVLNLYLHDWEKNFGESEKEIEEITGRQKRVLENVLNKNLHGPLTNQNIADLQEAGLSKEFIEDLAGPDRLRPANAKVDQLMDAIGEEKYGIDVDFEQLQELGPHAVKAKPTLQKILVDKKRPLLTRGMALGTLLVIDPTITPSPEWGPLLITILTDPDHYQFEKHHLVDEAERLLATMGNSVIDELKKELARMNFREIKGAQNFLTNLGEKAAPLVEVLGKRLEDKDSSVCKNVAETLGQMPKVAVLSIPFLMQALTDPNDDIVIFAISALGNLGPEAASIALLKLEAIEKTHENENVRQAAAKAIEQLKETTR